MRAKNTIIKQQELLVYMLSTKLHMDMENDRLTHTQIQADCKRLRRELNILSKMNREDWE